MYENYKQFCSFQVYIATQMCISWIEKELPLLNVPSPYISLKFMGQNFVNIVCQMCISWIEKELPLPNVPSPYIFIKFTG